MGEGRGVGSEAAGSGRGTIDEVNLWMSTIVVSRILIFSWRNF